MSKHRFYRIWENMKTRCLNEKTKNYHRYGGRGIKICPEWMDFINFKNDMFESYLKHSEEFGEKNTKLDRKNNDGNYEKSNCVWSTHKEQAANTSRIKPFIAISPEGVVYEENVQIEFCRKHNLDQRTVNKCINGVFKQTKGWTFKAK